MSKENTSSSASSPSDSAPQRKDRASEIANTFEWLITAFILAFVFRAFVMEAFRIPTGSMADTLRGAHFRLRCVQCGYKHEHGYVPNVPDTVPAEEIPLPTAVKCPNCGHAQQSTELNPAMAQVVNGDRILVLKCLYQFSQPKRWDVIVFKNPSRPSENYIKRLIGLPNEQIEIIDGDIYVNGQIARKPYMVQKEHWMPIYDNDYQPVKPEEHWMPLYYTEIFTKDRPVRSASSQTHWQNPFEVSKSQWHVKADDPTCFALDTPGRQNPSVLSYGSASANRFVPTYAYNDAKKTVDRLARMTPPARTLPVCSDLRVRLYVDSQREGGRIGVALGKYGVLYRGQVDLTGNLVISKVTEDGEKVLKTQALAHLELNKPTRLTFSNVDRRLILQFGASTLVEDLDGTAHGLEGDRNALPEVQIFGSGRLEISHVAIFRDTHYIDYPGKRAHEGAPFQLHDDQFFVLGDNSPNSSDGRLWGAPMVASRGQEPPAEGIVPRNYLVGKAMFVYWPSGFKTPWPENMMPWLKRLKPSSQGQSPKGFNIRKLPYAILFLNWIPNIGQMRYIYGGSGKEAF